MNAGFPSNSLHHFLGKRGIEKMRHISVKQRSPYIDVEQLVETLFGDDPEANRFANAGVDENDIDLPLTLETVS